jgi:hypothetical protein
VAVAKWKIFYFLCILFGSESSLKFKEMNTKLCRRMRKGNKIPLLNNPVGNIALQFSITQTTSEGGKLIWQSSSP